MSGRNNSCDSNLLSRFLDGETDPQETDRLRDHLRACPLCRQAAADQHRLAELLRLQVAAVQPDVDYDRFEMQILRAARQPKPPDRIYNNLLSWKIMLPLATAAALILFFFLPLFQAPPPSGPSAIIKSFTGRVSSVMILETPRNQQTVIWYSEETPADDASRNAQNL